MGKLPLPWGLGPLHQPLGMTGLTPAFFFLQDPCCRLLMGRRWKKAPSATWCSPGGQGAAQGPGREVGGSSGASGHASPTRAPCLSEAGT